jgi:hypothetical protein
MDKEKSLITIDSIIKMKISFKNTFFQDVLFIALLLFIYFYLGFYDAIFASPGGIHFIRQTDSLSFVQVFYNDGNSIFQPRLFNLKNSGGHAACEFPIIYYITALLYHIFGEKEFLLRIVHLFIISIGLFLVFKMAKEILKDFYYAAFIVIFLFTSTVLGYYSVNYLPDIESLGFVMIGWFYFYKHSQFRKSKQIIYAYFFFGLAALIKPTYLINPLSIFSFLVVENYIFHLKKHADLMKIHLRGILCCILAVIAWSSFIIWYNQYYHSNSFLTSILPIWKINIKEIYTVYDILTNYWGTDYFAKYSLWFLCIAIFINLIIIKKSIRTLSILTATLFSGSVAYTLLFYSQLKDHDYYCLVFVPLVILILINFFDKVIKLFPSLSKSVFLKICLGGVLVIGLHQAELKLERRYSAKFYDDTKEIRNLKALRPKLDVLNIPDDATFIIFKDASQNSGLLFINKKGWLINESETAMATIRLLKNEGADYLILTMNKLKEYIKEDEFTIKIFDDGMVSVYEM